MRVLTFLVLAAVTACGTSGAPDAADDGDPSPPGSGGGPGSLPVEDPVVPPVRRLAVREVGHALADLVGEDVTDGVTLPEDARPDGFDHLPSAAPLSDAFIQGLGRLAARAGRAWAASVVAEEAGDPVGDLVPPADCFVDDLAEDGTFQLLYLNGARTTEVTAPVDGTYTLAFDAFHRHGTVGANIHRLGLAIDGALDEALQLSNALEPRSFAFEVTLDAGTHTLEVWYVDGPEDDSALSELEFGPEFLCTSAHGVAVGRMRFGPADASTWACDGRDDAGCVADVLRPFVRRAWRRPPTDAEVARLAEVYLAARPITASDRQALALAAEAVLLSPHFLFVVDAVDAAGRLTPHALAQRLALALWASVPDEALDACADAGTLGPGTGPCGLAAQVARMLEDPRAARFVAGFGAQWLGLDALDRAREAAVQGVEGAVDLALLDAFEAETLAVLEAHLRAPDHPVVDLVGDPHTWVDRDLAVHYGLPVPSDAGFAEVASPGRPGVVSHGSILVMTSSGTRTSPVRRGIWVLDKLACDPPDPPPPGVPGFPDDLTEPADVAEALAAHRDNPACAACHDDIDPVGLALEGFGPDGRLREVSLGGTTPDGTPLSSVHDLVGWLEAEDRAARCIASRVATYVVGTPVPPEAPLAAAVARASSWREALVALVTSDPFLTRSLGEAP